MQGIMKRLQLINGTSENTKGAPLLPLREELHMQPQKTMTPYEKAQLEVASRIRRIRELVTQLDGLSADASRKFRVEVSQQIRKEELQAKVEMQNARRVAQSEGRMQDFELLSRHFNDTLDIVRERYGGGLPVAKPGGSTFEREPLPFTDLEYAVNQSAFLASNSGNVVPKPGNAYNLHEDVEFLQFFYETQKNDEVIDKSLDCIYVGVQRLNQNATVITSELCTQEQMLDETEKKMDDVHGRLGKLNVKLKKALERMDRPMMAVYLICCLILLSIIVIIYFMAKK
ncbi:hypothetical protein C3747_45g162 [Trypanosoma cruzi]|uniref:Syntaxin n=2 Tax=Trypanosoma cruzi TaxID=5693 RepID=Q4E2I3_TRYCC|nr:hypothetical protein, conserved [Trypanosoma cruzi]EAN98986.1 hypothetical protein, conserved [Trypanosoma cruzi]PWV13156.1 hypothetical protein C3747_45g162 [Trypanosoma cruzi]|eukprot:XP_820837.1 hypothetical protein [Trypanosoma cruzi strain CL Brener]